MIGPPLEEGRAGDVGQFAGPAHPELWREAPLGHFTSTHAAFGWCCHESDRDVNEEVWAWRLRYDREVQDGEAL